MLWYHRTAEEIRLNLQKWLGSNKVCKQVKVFVISG